MSRNVSGRLICTITSGAGGKLPNADAILVWPNAHQSIMYVFIDLFLYFCQQYAEGYYV